MSDSIIDGSCSEATMRRWVRSRKSQIPEQTFREIPVIVVDAGSSASESTTSSRSNVCRGKEDKELLSPKDAERYRSKAIRKNSISLPNLDDFEQVSEEILFLGALLL